MNSSLHATYTSAYSLRMTIANRLDEAMKAAGIPSQNALARLSDIPQPTINRILKGVGKKGPEAHTVVRLAEACNVSFQWLYEGTGPMGRGPEVQRDEVPSETVRLSVDDKDGGKFVGVRMLTRVIHAGMDGVDGDFEYDDGIALSLPLDWVQAKRLDPVRLVALKVKGQSMYPTMREGDVVIVNTADRIPLDGELFAVNHHHKPVVKRLEREGGSWYLASDNRAPAYGRRPVEEDTEIVGRVVRMQVDFI
jgi:phage repressor protein C with HTH and peptisase S24 domain